MFMGLCVTALAVPAQADVRSYCEAYARNQADTRLTGSAILGAAAAAPSPEERKARNTLALADCLALYTPEAAIETTAMAKPEAEPVKAKPKTATAKDKLILLARRTAPAQQEKSDADIAALVPGTAAWEDYCAAKYASFNRDTDTYTSLSGKQRPCRVTKG